MIDFPEPNKKFISDWVSLADKLNIPKETYYPRVKVLADPKGKSPHTFGVILSPHRTNRPQDYEKNIKNCPLCQVVKSVETDSSKALAVESKLRSFVIVPNLFPLVLGHSLAISEGTDINERPMCNTSNLEGTIKDFQDIFSCGSSLDLQAAHNSEGAGASIPNHEHWHLVNWHNAFSTADKVYGFEAAETERMNLSSVCTMPGFPFAHVIFPENDPERIVDFLRKLGKDLGSGFQQGYVPHLVIQGRSGILVAPCKNYLSKGSIGAGHLAGHITCKDLDEFQRKTYEDCVQKLKSQLFEKDKLDLTKFL